MKSSDPAACVSCVNTHLFAAGQKTSLIFCICLAFFIIHCHNEFQ